MAYPKQFDITAAVLTAIELIDLMSRCLASSSSIQPVVNYLPSILTSAFYSPGKNIYFPPFAQKDKSSRYKLDPEIAHSHNNSPVKISTLKALSSLSKWVLSLMSEHLPPICLIFKLNHVSPLL